MSFFLGMHFSSVYAQNLTEFCKYSGGSIDGVTASVPLLRVQVLSDCRHLASSLPSLPSAWAFGPPETSLCMSNKGTSTPRTTISLRAPRVQSRQQLCVCSSPTSVPPKAARAPLAQWWRMLCERDKASMHRKGGSAAPILLSPRPWLSALCV